MDERLQGSDQRRIAQILDISRDMHGVDALYMYTKGGQTKVLTATEATKFCAHHMVVASDKEIREVLDLWRAAFVDKFHEDPEEVKRARLRGKIALRELGRG